MTSGSDSMGEIFNGGKMKRRTKPQAGGAQRSRSVTRKNAQSWDFSLWCSFSFSGVKRCLTLLMKLSRFFLKLPFLEIV